ncbi:AAA family ATPase [Piscirickettsia salmonis]|uniref:Secretion ATPase, PEP-CTERM locus subfamily n=1 Tax=Piscirickettsia salmonis TaxID=1238 RepID=A0A9Q5VLG8_PISSA|nr:ATP-binding protein [Piscirickettsia salmonis]RNC77723.1 ATP-binding protein [Piscirickettsiaceae bacterium NZ-RLO2]ALA23625.1 AAA domain protein [Piscirickettsia salmonis]APS44067.1 AAA family ATPase [Piscirickettsia salmonis]APS47427.1 AAA family ATPase [Piscirickettsia salmonis]APS51137.1 AAA family ATPase [Piscirickettsia salmonis]
MAYAYQAKKSASFLRRLNNPFDSDSKGFKPYITPGWNKQLELIGHTVCYSDYVVAVYGPIGAGKSTFLELLKQRLDKRAQFSHLQGESKHSELTTLRAIAVALYLPPADHCTTIEHCFDYIYKYMAERRHTGVSYVLTVDHADHFGPKILSMLQLLAAKLRDQKGCMLHFLLFGEERLIRQLKEILGDKSWQEYLYCCKLKPFSDVEVQLYLDDKLRSLSEAFAFSERDIDLVLKGAVGLPGRINQISRQLVQQKEPKQTRAHRGYRNWAVVFSLLVLISVVVSYLSNQPSWHDSARYGEHSKQSVSHKTTAGLKPGEVSVPLILPGKASSG